MAKTQQQIIKEYREKMEGGFEPEFPARDSVLEDKKGNKKSNVTQDKINDALGVLFSFL